jgi:hypothetical protein
MRRNSPAFSISVQPRTDAPPRKPISPIGGVRFDMGRSMMGGYCLGKLTNEFVGR